MVPNTLSTMLFEAWHVNVVLFFQKSLAPSLPEDLAISFYIQSHKLIFAVYQLSNVHGTMKFDSHQAECSIPWLNEVLVLFTVALQLCQQLKDKVMLYTTFFDPALGPPFSVLQFESFSDLTYGLIIPSTGVYWSPHYTTSAELMCKHSEHDSSSLEANPAQSISIKEIHCSRMQAWSLLILHSTLVRKLAIYN